MPLHPLAGQPVPQEILPNIPQLMSAYYTNTPDMDEVKQRVSFGTSGHRGTSLDNTFTDTHIAAISQALCEYRIRQGYDGPLFLGMDTHALSEAAFRTAVAVFAANGVDVRIAQGYDYEAENPPTPRDWWYIYRRYTPTPVISHAILTYNHGRDAGLADGVIITPSHNPPQDGGFKYNPPNGGPADGKTTKTIQNRANDIIATGLREVQRMSISEALTADNVQEYDYITPYVEDLAHVVNMDAITGAKLKIGVDPMGGAGIAYWPAIAEHYGLNIEVVNKRVDPTFSFMTIDKDGKIRMDCSSPYAMAGLIGLKDDFDIAFGNDPDYDRHGIVTKSSGLLNPNHYLAVAIQYLFQNRPDWPDDAAVGKTLVSSSMIDRVAHEIGQKLAEVPVGFKWFVDGLEDGSYGFGGEESAGASFLRLDGTTWTTDKDGIILDLLAAEILAVTGKDPGELYAALEEKYGSPVYKRSEAPATLDQKAALKELSPEMVTADQMAGEPIQAKLTNAPGNGAAIGGLKVVTENGWFAARPSGTEAIYKIYAESFKGEQHLAQIQSAAQEIVQEAFKAAGLA